MNPKEKRVYDTGEDDIFNYEEITLCKTCHCMTKTIKERCGKCGGEK